MFRSKIANLAFLFLILLPLTSAFDAARPASAVALLEGRTYDQAHNTGFIDWSGTVQYFLLIHKDGSSLPPEEGGASCLAGCQEQITRISNGSAVSGSFTRDVTYFEVMVAFSHDFGVGDAVLSACSASSTYTLYAGPGFSLPGFVSMPLNVPAGCRTWTLTASGGYVDFRSVDVTYVTAPPTATATLTFTSTPTTVFTPTATRTSTPTRTPLPSATSTGTATSTRTPTSSPTFTSTPSTTNTATHTPLPTATYTATSTSTTTSTSTPSPTPTFTPLPSFTPTRIPTATRTLTSTPTQTPISIPTFTSTASPTATLTQTATSTLTNSPAPTMIPLPPAVSLTEHWWIWESGILKVIPKTFPITSVRLTISDPQNRWPAVVLEYDPRKVPELVFWDRRFADGTLAPPGDYHVAVRACDDHGLCASALGTISIPDGDVPTSTLVASPTVTFTAMPSITPTMTRILASPTPVLVTPTLIPIDPVRPNHSWPVWQLLSLLGLFLVIASASVVDPRPVAVDRLRETVLQISNQNNLDSSKDEK